MHSGPPFCSGAGTDMHMTGFAFFPTDCVIYLFREWRLDSAAKFAFAVLGTVLLGVLTEWLTHFRREKLAPSSATRLKGRPRLWHVAMAAIFTIQARAAADAAARPPARPTDRPSFAPPASPLTRLSHPQATLGYFLMLVAMTYQGELFIAVIAGLGLGHGAFNVHAPVAGTDACCVEPAPPTAKQQGEKEVLKEVSARVAAGVTPVEAAPPVTTVLAVEGMTCDGCTATVVAALAAVPGVEAVQVSLSEGTATVRGAAPPAELRARVVASGHAARVLRDPSVPAGVPVGAEHAGTWRDGDVTCWSRSAAEAAELL